MNYIIGKKSYISNHLYKFLKQKKIKVKIIDQKKFEFSNER